jgi:hypothetical protein
VIYGVASRILLLFFFEESINHSKQITMKEISILMQKNEQNVQDHYQDSDKLNLNHLTLLMLAQHREHISAELDDDESVIDSIARTLLRRAR